MENFEKVLLRCKEQLSVSTDKEVAELLGLSVKAFTARKSRDSFPTDKLLAFSAMHPELKVDTDYILQGWSVRRNTEQMAEVAAGIQKNINETNQVLQSLGATNVGEGVGVYGDISTDETLLLRLFRQSTGIGREAIIATARAVEKNKE